MFSGFNELGEVEVQLIFWVCFEDFVLVGQFQVVGCDQFSYFLILFGCWFDIMCYGYKQCVCVVVDVYLFIIQVLDVGIDQVVVKGQCQWGFEVKQFFSYWFIFEFELGVDQSVVYMLNFIWLNFGSLKCGVLMMFVFVKNSFYSVWIVVLFRGFV